MSSPKLRHNIDHEVVKNGIVYKLAKTEEELEQVMDFIFDIFLKDEPICTATQIDTTDKRPAHFSLFRGILEDGISLIALDSAKDNQMVGIRVSFTIPKEKATGEKKSKEDMMKEGFSEHWALILPLLDQLVVPHELFKNNPGHEKMVEFMALCTRDDYRGKGIAGELVQQAFEVGKKAGCDCVGVVASSPYSRRIFEKKGMTELSRITREELQQSEIGKLMVKPEAIGMMTGHFMSLK